MITDAYEGGATMASPSAQHTVKRQLIAALLQREGIAIRARKVISPEHIDQAGHRNGSGQSRSVIGDRLGFDATSISGGRSGSRRPDAVSERSLELGAAAA